MTFAFGDKLPVIYDLLTVNSVPHGTDVRPFVSTKIIFVDVIYLHFTGTGSVPDEDAHVQLDAEKSGEELICSDAHFIVILHDVSFQEIAGDAPLICIRLQTSCKVVNNS